MCTRLASRVARSRVCKQGLLFHITCMYQYVTVVRALFLRSNMLRCSTAFRTSRATADNNHSNSNNDKQKKRKHQNTLLYHIYTHIYTRYDTRYRYVISDFKFGACFLFDLPAWFEQQLAHTTNTLLAICIMRSYSAFN